MGARKHMDEHEALAQIIARTVTPIQDRHEALDDAEKYLIAWRELEHGGFDVDSAEVVEVLGVLRDVGDRLADARAIRAVEFKATQIVLSGGAK